MPNQSKYRLFFSSPEELKRFTHAATPFIVSPRLTQSSQVGATNGINPKYSQWEWRENIWHDKAMVRSNDPLLMTRITLVLQKLTNVEQDPNSLAQYESRHQSSKFVMHPRSGQLLYLCARCKKRIHLWN